jgi:hypothetical protein
VKTEGELVDMLQIRYPAPEYATISHVRNGTGWVGKRTADAISLSLWQSRGIALHGFEIKCSRTDWIKELKDPEKADMIASYCDFWWLVVADKDIVKDGELPLNWGMIAAKGEKLYTIKAAPQLTDVKPLDKPFVAAVMRRIQESKTEDARLMSIKSQEYSRGYEDGRKLANGDHERLKRAHDLLYQTVKEFEDASGIEIQARYLYRNGMEPKDVGKAVMTVLKGAHHEEFKNLVDLRDRLSKVIDEHHKQTNGLPEDPARDTQASL